MHTFPKKISVRCNVQLRSGFKLSSSSPFMACILIIQGMIQFLIHGMYLHHTTEDTNPYSWHVSSSYEGRYKSLFVACIFVIQQKIKTPTHGMLFMGCIFNVQRKIQILICPMYLHHTKGDTNPYTWHAIHGMYFQCTTEDANPYSWHVSLSYKGR